MWRKLMIAALAAAFWTPANAMPITYSWTGTVTNNDSGFPGIAVGEKIGISLTLDNSFPDQNPSPNIGLYECSFCFPSELVLAVNFGGAFVVNTEVPGLSAGSVQIAEVSQQRYGGR